MLASNAASVVNTWIQHGVLARNDAENCAQANFMFTFEVVYIIGFEGLGLVDPLSPVLTATAASSQERAAAELATAGRQARQERAAAEHPKPSPKRAISEAEGQASHCQSQGEAEGSCNSQAWV